MFVAGVVCPHPPLLVPELAQGAANELDGLRDACATAMRALLAGRPDVVICVGDGPGPSRYDEACCGTLSGYGVDVRAGADSARAPELPLSLTMAAWLLDRARWRGARRYLALPKETPAQECAWLGATTAAAADMRVAVLALGDGSARRSEQAPGYLDPRARLFDAAVAAALGTADLGWLRTHPDPAVCAELLVAGRQAWQFLAGAAQGTPPGAALSPRLLHDRAPYGVGYLVASWTLVPAT